MPYGGGEASSAQLCFRGPKQKVEIVEMLGGEAARICGRFVEGNDRGAAVPFESLDQGVRIGQELAGFSYGLGSANLNKHAVQDRTMDGVRILHIGDGLTDRVEDVSTP